MAGGSAAGAYDPGSDPYSMYAITNAIGAQSFWSAGDVGQGVDVALVDTGVSPVPGLDGPGKIVYGPDLSLESQSPNLANLDTNGHGTFMAGLIAGSQGPAGNASPSTYEGVAPGARIVSIKVGTADGGTDVTQVIAAIDWVVQHAHDPGFNIRVLNLSYGTNSTQDYRSDPLAYAVEQAWKHGVVVVAAAGNSGWQHGVNAPGLADPSYDPYVIAVGASDTGGGSRGRKDTVADFSAGAGTGNARMPDLVAPGAHLQGLRVANSYVDANNPGGVLDGTYFRGSGTSMSAAVVSGAVALLLEQYPTATPDMVKAFLEQFATKLPGSRLVQGAGEINLAPLLHGHGPVAASQSYDDSTGTGSIELARGTDHIAQNGVVLQGEQDIFGHGVDTANLAALEASASSWSGGAWNGSSWSGSSWSGSSWSGSSWSGSSWSGSSWSASSWSGSSWSGSSWSGSSWSGSSWSGASWS